MQVNAGLSENLAIGPPYNGISECRVCFHFFVDSRLSPVYS
jgi:hypothetical protein